MRIISKHNEYYDGVVKSGIDLTQVFERDKVPSVDKIDVRNLTSQKQFSKFTRLCSEYQYRSGMDKNTGEQTVTEYVPKLVFFCGDWYPIVQLTTTKYIARSVDSVEVSANFLSAKSLGDHFTYLVDTCSRYFIDKFQKNPQSSMHTHLEYFFNTEHTCGLSDVCEKFRYPYGISNKLSSCMYVNGTELTKINPVRLDDINFQRVKPPYEAFQEISMYVGNVMLASNNAPQIIDDKVLRDSKGFDKYSFKKGKSTK